MSSLIHTSSQFDKNASTIDGTQVSLQHYDVSMRTDIDKTEQAHNAMNLALGKPTQSFAMYASKQVSTKKEPWEINIKTKKNKGYRDSLGQDSLYSKGELGDTPENKTEN